jgi:DNA polymerase III epsilon subunit-like protein
MKLLIVDTETTGLPKHRKQPIENTSDWPHIIQLSYILYDTTKNKMIVMHDWIIKIDSSVIVSPESEAIHGISYNKSRSEGILMQDALIYYNICMDNADVVIGHNLVFDKSMIQVEGIRNQIPMFTQNILEYCTMLKSIYTCKLLTISKQYPFDSYYKWPTLVELHKHLFNGVSPSGVHNSWVDILVCMRCYYLIEHQEDLYITSHGFKMKFKKYII